jgi:hypothetical protein
MTESNDHGIGARLLPGIDLTLWLRLILAVFLTAVVIAIGYVAT